MHDNPAVYNMQQLFGSKDNQSNYYLFQSPKGIKGSVTKHMLHFPATAPAQALLHLSATLHPSDLEFFCYEELSSNF